MSDCFVIFEGGGAKGITHLGALKALEEVGLVALGVAGTSAGAIVAALAAVGYSADELFDGDNGRNILDRCRRTPVDLLGATEWSLFRRLVPGSRSKAAQDVASLARKVAFAGLLLVEPFWWTLVLSHARRTGRPSLLGRFWDIVDSFGFFSTEHARDILNGLLRNRLAELGVNPVPQLVRFKDIDPVSGGTGLPLKIIATNLESKGLELFDRSRPHVVIADAVAASFAIPLFFKPAVVREVDDAGCATELEARFADGGLVSNLPIWVFSEEKRTIERSPSYRGSRPLPIVALTLKDGGVAAAAPAARLAPLVRFMQYGVGVLRTGIFGGQSVASRFVPNLTIVELPTPLGLIQFDCTRAQAIDAFNAGREAAARRLADVFRIYPSARREGLRDIISIAQAESDRLRDRLGRPRVAQFRACLVRKLSIQFKVVESINMDDDTDDDLVLDQDNPGAPTAFASRAFRSLHIGPHTDLTMTKYERALVRRSLASSLLFPIFETISEWDKPPNQRSEPKGVLCLDSDTLLEVEEDDNTFVDALRAASIRFGPLMSFEGQT